jgi:hypothetical protein
MRSFANWGGRLLVLLFLLSAILLDGPKNGKSRRAHGGNHRERHDDIKNVFWYSSNINGLHGPYPVQHRRYA